MHRSCGGLIWFKWCQMQLTVLHLHLPTSSSPSPLPAAPYTSESVLVYPNNVEWGSCRILWDNTGITILAPFRQTPEALVWFYDDTVKMFNEHKSNPIYFNGSNNSYYVLAAKSHLPSNKVKTTLTTCPGILNSVFCRQEWNFCEVEPIQSNALGDSDSKQIQRV